MTITVRPAQSRGHENHGWLDSRHTFSFANYHDSKHMGFGPLRVVNEDRVQPGAGFAAHGHRDMEILSYVIEGALAHKDSLGAGSVIRPGDVQVMTAGTGIRHSEFNASKVDPVHFLQIWLLPERQGLQPRYDQKTFPEAEKRGRLRLVASHDGRDGSLLVHQDADVFATLLNDAQSVVHALKAGRRAWVQIVRGSAEIDGVPVRAGDGAAIEGASALIIASREPGAEILVFDLP
ncbi:MAG: pirin family protein [Roseiarcus sp.]|jgi:redox-sensitive bicupin YhaK (pirin superfamily)